MARFFSNKKKPFYVPFLIFTVIILAMAAGCNHSKPLALKPGENIRALLHLEYTGPFYIGTSIPLILTVESRKGVSYEIPQYDGKAAGSLELKIKQPLNHETFSEGSRQSIRYVLSGWHVDQFTIPATNLAYETPSHQHCTIKLPSIKIKLASVLPKGKSEEELLSFNSKEIKPPLGLEPHYSMVKWFLFGALFLIIIGLLLHIYQRSHTEKTASESYQEPAHVIAFRRLANLKMMEISGSAGFKVFYSELSECIREYMKNRYSIRALEMTTEEFLMHLTTGIYLNPEQQSWLKSFMQQSDLVKFANHSPSLAEAERALQQIEQLVDSTKELPVQPDIPGNPVPTTL
ncbi:MAG TPA: hypothetical protein DDW65_00645 [Firmicutes bacterium]|jgi:hypothetical protein|nr:hypothetical protein [Bacillota bacterium]